MKIIKTDITKFGLCKATVNMSPEESRYFFQLKNMLKKITKEFYKDKTPIISLSFYYDSLIIKCEGKWIKLLIDFTHEDGEDIYIASRRDLTSKEYEELKLKYGDKVTIFQNIVGNITIPDFTFIDEGDKYPPYIKPKRKIIYIN